MKMIMASQMKEVTLTVQRETFSSFEGAYLSHSSPHSRKSQGLGLGLDGGFVLMHG